MIMDHSSVQKAGEFANGTAKHEPEPNSQHLVELFLTVENVRLLRRVLDDWLSASECEGDVRQHVQALHAHFDWIQHEAETGLDAVAAV
jgi:hypothetical protein